MSAYSDLVLSHGATAYWRMNDVSGAVQDSVGSRHGVVSGPVSYGQPGRAGGETAVVLDATGTGRILPPSLPPTGTAFTLEFWGKPSALPGAATRFGLILRQITTDGDFQWSLEPNGTVLKCYYYTTGPGYQNYSVPVSLTLGAWVHLVLSVGAGFFRAYVNGVAQTPMAGTAAGAGGASVPSLASWNEVGGETWAWQGAVSDVAIYPTALSAAQITQHYTVGTTSAIPSAGCDHTTVWSTHLATLSAPTVESERASLATLYGEPGGTDMSTLVSRYLQEITCGTPPAPPPPPTVSLVSPNTGTQGTMVTVTLTGTGFIAGATGVSVNGVGISVVNIHVTSPTTLTADLAIAADAPPTARTITVTTAGGSSSQAFTVAVPASLLARVQAWTKQTSSIAQVVPFRCTPRPTVGNALIVFINLYRSAPSTQVIASVVDTNSNPYQLAGTVQANGTVLQQIWYCPKLTSTALGSFFDLTITASAGSVFYVVQVVEVTGVGAGLVVDQSVGATGSSAAPATGATPALTASTVFQAAAHAIAAAQTTITVASQSPAWTEDVEELPFNVIAGEGDTRLVPSALGTTPSLSWTDTATGLWAAGLIAFKAS